VPNLRTLASEFTILLVQCPLKPDGLVRLARCGAWATLQRSGRQFSASTSCLHLLIRHNLNAWSRCARQSRRQQRCDLFVEDGRRALRSLPPQLWNSGVGAVARVRCSPPAPAAAEPLLADALARGYARIEKSKTPLCASHYQALPLSVMAAVIAHQGGLIRSVVVIALLQRTRRCRRRHRYKRLKASQSKCCIGYVGTTTCTYARLMRGRRTLPVGYDLRVPNSESRYG